MSQMGPDPVRDGAILIATNGRPTTRPDMFDGRYTQNDSTGGRQHRYGADANWGVLDDSGHWRHLANTTELVLPLAHLSPQPKL